MSSRGQIAVALAFLFVAGARGEKVSPLGAGLREEVELFVTCALEKTPRPAEIPVLQSKAEREAAPGIYHYKLWLPHGYLTQPQRRWPCIFIASPFGNAHMVHMGPRLKASGYVVVMLMESRNGPWAPTIGNFLAAHDDVVRRIRIQEGAKIATGLSGGARASSIFVQLRPGFAGLILQGAGVARDEHGQFDYGGLTNQPSLCVAMIMGRSDPRVPEISEVQQHFDPKRFAAFLFSGTHQWAPSPEFDQALTWIENLHGHFRNS